MASEQHPPSSGTVHQAALNFVFAAKAQKLVNCAELRSHSFNCGDYTDLSLKAEVLRVFPQLKPIENAMDIAVNEKYVTSNKSVVLKDNDVIAVLPHVTAMDECDLFPYKCEDVTVKFLFFGIAGSLTCFGTCESVITVGEYTGFGLKQMVLRTFQVLEPIKNNIIIAVNGEYITDDETVVVNKGDTIAVIPPLSGG